MAQPLQSINLVAPAFKGINTEDSPLAQDPSFAEIADNAVIDKRGRIAARKGNAVITTDKTELGTDFAHKLHYFYDDANNSKLFSAGNNKILSGTTTLVDETPAGYTVSGNNWKMLNFNDAAYFFQRGLEPLIYTDSGGLQTWGDYNGTATSSQYFCHEALAAYGRLWIVDNAADTQTIHWSDLLIGTSFTGGSTGSIDVSKAWPDGYDEVRALAAHNNLLIVFGKHSIIVYEGASSPATMSIADTVAGVGCVCRNSVQHIGTDVLFLDQSGLRSFGRTIQEKSMPINDLSLNIKTEFIEAIAQRTGPTSSVFSPENSFYLISFPNQQITYCFDLKGTLENGAYRVTRWTTNLFKSYERKPDGTLYIGSAQGVGEYVDYSDNGESYRFRYYSPGLTFGDPSKLKILKKLRPTIVGANSATVILYWGYDLTTEYRSTQFTVGNQIPFYFSSPTNVQGDFIAAGGLSEYSDPRDAQDEPIGAGGLAQFTGGALTSRRQINTTGGGSVVTIGLESDINGFPLSLQEINVLALIGKTL
jgi:hypothetical protein